MNYGALSDGSGRVDFTWEEVEAGGGARIALEARGDAARIAERGIFMPLPLGLG